MLFLASFDFRYSGSGESGELSEAGDSRESDYSDGETSKSCRCTRAVSKYNQVNTTKQVQLQSKTYQISESSELGEPLESI